MEVCVKEGGKRTNKGGLSYKMSEDNLDYLFKRNYDYSRVKKTFYDTKQKLIETKFWKKRKNQFKKI
jgi:hypothetical protein